MRDNYNRGVAPCIRLEQIWETASNLVVGTITLLEISKKEQNTICIL